MENIFHQVENNMNELAERNVWWSGCASEQQIADARNGNLSLPIGIDNPVPADWISDIVGKDVLCLAGAGGLQAPLLAAAGAHVTVLDISGKMLEKDHMMSEKYQLSIRIVKGTMTDLSVFSDGCFDYIINPVSLCYVPDVRPVFAECSRVLKKGGSLILAAPSPIAYVCDFIEDKEGGYYKAVNRMPYISSEHPEQGDWLEFGHTTQDYIGGQIAAGFVITGYVEEQHSDITELFFISKATKT